jgi:hypothetical protein
MSLQEILDDSATTDTKASDQGAPQGEIGQSVNSKMFPNPVSDFHVKGMGLGRESCPSDLLRGKEPCCDCGQQFHACRW